MKRIIYISIITILLFSIFGCSEKRKVKTLIEKSNILIENHEFKKAKEVIDSAEIFNKWDDLDTDIFMANYKLEYMRKIYGCISDSLLNEFISKYDLNAKYDEDGSAEYYYTNENFYFEVDNDGDLGTLYWSIFCPLTDKTPEYVEDIEITTNSYFYVRDYNFYKIESKGGWFATESIYASDDAEKIQWIKDVVSSSPVEVKFCGIDNNFNYLSRRITLDRNTWNAFWEIAKNLW